MFSLHSKAFALPLIPFSLLCVRFLSMVFLIINVSLGFSSIREHQLCRFSMKKKPTT